MFRKILFPIDWDIQKFIDYFIDQRASYSVEKELI